MNRAAKLFGKNHWLFIVQCFALFSVGIYGRTVTNQPVLQTKIFPWLMVALFSLYNILCITFNKKFVFQNTARSWFADPPLRKTWKRWFFLLYTPYAVYSIWFGIVLTIYGVFFVWLFTAAMCFTLYCAYLRLSMDEEQKGS